jgi:hypothetical protein
MFTQGFRNLFIHKKNNVSFSYKTNSINHYNFNIYNTSLIDHHTPTDTHSIVHKIYRYRTLNNQYHNINTIKDGVYHHNKKWIHTFINVNDLYQLYQKSPNLYLYVLNLLYLDTMESTKKLAPSHISYLSSTYTSQNPLNINYLPYYQVHMKNSYQPIYLQEKAKLFDSNGNKVSVLDIVSKLGKRTILGLDNNHNLKEFDISKIVLINPNHNKNIFDLPFINIGFQIMNKTVLYNSLILNNIIVELD